MSYIVKLCYLPLLDDTSYYFTQPLKVDKSLLETSLTANNISFVDNEIRVTVNDTLGGTSDSNLFKSNYNCLLLYNDSKKYFEVYKVTSINFIGGKQINVRGVLSNYTLDKLETIETEFEYLLRNRDKLQSKSGYIKYGYAYDSVLKADGTVNLDGYGGTDIYKPVEFKNINLLRYRRNLSFRTIFDSSYYPNDSLSNTFNSFIKGWIYIYCEPRQYELNGRTVNVPRVLGSNVGGLSFSYGVVVAPILEDGKTITFNGLRNVISGFIDVASPYIYNVKISGRPPFKLLENQITFNGNNCNITYSGSYLENDFNRVIFDEIQTGETCIVALVSVTNQIFETTPLNYSELYPYYPRGFDGQTVSKSEFENYKINPYIRGHSTLLRITDGFGGVRDYTPFELGIMENGLVFEYHEVLTPDISKIYITPKISMLEKSLLNENSNKAYIGMVNNVDLSLPYSVDQLTSYLAQNKNFFQQAMVNTMAKFQGGSERSANSFIASYFSKSKQGMASAINRQSDALYDLGLSIYNTNITKDNLKNAPDSLNNVKSNYLWLLSIQEDLKPAVELYSADYYSMKSAWERFCRFGILLDKNMNGIDIHKYINNMNGEYDIYGNEIKFDKTNYKYVEGDVTLYDYYSWYLNQQDVLENTIRNGMKIISVEANIGNEPKADYDVMLEINEEDFYFE